MTKNMDFKTWHGDFSIKVMSHPVNGRYIVATEDLEESSVILQDLPYTWAVDHASKNYVCQQCFLEVPNNAPVVEAQKEGDSSDSTTPDTDDEEKADGATLAEANNKDEFLMCTVCDFVGYCCAECMKLDSHQHALECKVFRNLDTSEYSSSLLSEIKLLIRTLSRKWLEQSLGESGTQYEKYKTSTAVPQENGLRYSDYDQLVSNIDSFSPTLKESLLYWICSPVRVLSKKYNQKREDEVDLLNILLRNRCNAFYIQGRPKNGGNGESRGCGVYVRNSFFNHSCNPNVNYWVVDNTLEVECSLMRAVKKGEELCISYIDTAAGYKERREKLQEGYLFTCACEKCIKDENEANGICCNDQSLESVPTTINNDDDIVSLIKSEETSNNILSTIEVKVDDN